MWAKRTDTNQSAIIAAFRKCGATVEVIGQPVDIIIGYRGVTIPVEIKADEKETFTRQQDRFFRSWRGSMARINDVEGALQIIKTIDGLTK